MIVESNVIRIDQVDWTLVGLLDLTPAFLASIVFALFLAGSDINPLWSTEKWWIATMYQLKNSCL